MNRNEIDATRVFRHTHADGTYHHQNLAQARYLYGDRVVQELLDGGAPCPTMGGGELLLEPKGTPLLSGVQPPLLPRPVPEDAPPEACNLDAL